MFAGDRARWLAYVASSLPGAALAIAHGAGLVSEQITILLFVPSFVVLNAMHMAATWSRAYLDRGFASASPRDRVVVPLLVAALALGLESIGLAALLFGIQYYASIHHGLMQHYGIVRDGQRRAGRELSRGALWIDQAACLLPVLAALVYRATWIGTYEDAPLAAPPIALAAGLGGAGAIAIVALVAREVRAHLRGHAIDPVGLVVLLGVHALWVGLLVALRHPAIPLFAMASGHYVEHLFFVRRFEARRASALTLLPAPLRAVVGPARPLAYYAFLVALGGSGIVAITLLALALRAGASALGLRAADAMALPPWGAAMIAVNLHHYVLESRIWRAPTRSVSAHA